MKTHVIIDRSGEAISDAYALEFAKDNIGNKNICISTGVMLNAFRVLRTRGDIAELIVTFSNGEVLWFNEYGAIGNKLWPKDEVLDIEIELLAEIISKPSKQIKKNKENV